MQSIRAEEFVGSFWSTTSSRKIASKYTEEGDEQDNNWLLMILRVNLAVSSEKKMVCCCGYGFHSIKASSPLVEVASWLCNK